MDLFWPNNRKRIVQWHALSVASVAITEKSLVREGVDRLPHRGRLLLMQRGVVAQVAVGVRTHTLNGSAKRLNEIQT